MAKNYKNLSNEEILAEYSSQVSGAASKNYKKMSNDQVMAEYNNQINSGKKQNNDVFGIKGSGKYVEKAGLGEFNKKQVPESLQAFLGTSEASKEGALLGIQDLYQDAKAGLGYEDKGSREALNQKINANRQTKEGYRANSPWASLGGDILGGSLAYAPLMAVPGVGQSAISRNIGNPLLRNIGIGTSQGATQAGIEGLMQPTIGDESRMQNAEVYGATGGLIGGGMSGIMSGIQEMMPSRLLRGNTSPEQLAKNVETTRGTNASLGDVLENQGLRKLEQNWIPNIPFSGGAQSNQQVNHQINRMSEEFLNDVTGPDLFKIGDNASTYKQQLKESASGLQSEKRSKYKEQNELAKKHNLFIPDQGLMGVSQDIISKAMNNTRNPLNSELVSDAMKFLDPKTLNSSEFGLEAQNLLHAQLGQKAHQATLAGDGLTADYYKDMQKALKEDINRALENSPVPEIQQNSAQLNEWYKKNIVPLKDPLIKKHLVDNTGKKQDKIFNDIVKYGLNQDQSFVMDLFTRHFNEEGMQRLRQQALTQKGGLAQSLDYAFRNLGENQKKNLFKDALNKIPEWERISELRRLTPEASSPLANPMTGQRLLGMIGTAGTAGVGVMLGGLPGAMLALGGEAALGYGLNKILRSESVREKMVKEILKGPKNYDNLNALISSALARYVPLSANEPSSKKLEIPKQGKSVMVETLGEY